MPPLLAAKAPRLQVQIALLPSADCIVEAFSRDSREHEKGHVAVIAGSGARDHSGQGMACRSGDDLNGSLLYE